MPDDVERVRAVASDIPPGEVMTYGEIGGATGVHPRRVGRIVSAISDDIPWWRVVRADGTPPTCHGGTARALLEQEHVPFAGPKIAWSSLRETEAGRRSAGPGAG